MSGILKKIFSRWGGARDSASLPGNLLREGWIPYRFPDSEVTVVLPEELHAMFDQKGALHATSNRKNPDFSATLHSFPRGNRKLALDFVADLAEKKSAKPVDLATYRYFVDPQIVIEGNRGSHEIEFWVVGIPGSVVVLSFKRAIGGAFPPALESARSAIPYVIGELL